MYDDAEHVSPASLPGMYQRTIPVYTFSKSFAITGLRLGYLAIKDSTIRERVKKLLSFTASSVSSVIQHGGIGGLEGSQEWIERFRRELQARRDLFYEGIQNLGGNLHRRPAKGRVLRVPQDRSGVCTRPMAAPASGRCRGCSPNT